MFSLLGLLRSTVTSNLTSSSSGTGFCILYRISVLTILEPLGFRGTREAPTVANAPEHRDKAMWRRRLRPDEVERVVQRTEETTGGDCQYTD